MSILVGGGHILDPANQVDRVDDLYVADGKIMAIGATARQFAAETVIDASGLLVTPGFIDIGTHIPEPGYEYKGTIASETHAAAAGGFTSLCCTPDTAPIIDSPSVATLIQDRARDQGYTHLYPIGALTKGLAGEKLSEMGRLKDAGCIAFSNMRQPFSNNRILLRCLEYAASLDLLVLFSPSDDALEEGGCAHQGGYATRLGLPGIPASAETVALARDLLLVEQTGVRAHFGPISTARSVALIEEAQASGLPVTADTGIYQLLETEAAIRDFNSLYHVQPPLRSDTDREALRRGLRDGVLSAIRSDHKPHETAAKMAPFAATAAGISTLETMLPQALQLVEQQLLELDELITRLTQGPAAIMGLAAGTLGIGEVADICIFSPRERWQLRAESMLSRGHNSPRLNSDLCGRVRYTYTGGNRVYQSQRM